MGLFKFLKSLRTLANNRNISIKEAYKFAEQEFGEVTDLLKLQINKIFKEVEAPSIKKPSKPEGKVIEAVFKPGVDKRGKRVEQSPSQAEGTIMDRLGGAANRLEELMKEREAMYRPKQGLQVSEGLTRSLARKILDRKRIQIPKGQDPIDVFTDIFGEAVGDVKNLADEMVEIDQAGGGMKSMDEMLEAEGLYDIEIPSNPQRGLTDEELQKLIKEEDIKSEADEDYLRKIIDPEEPEDFATGGRVGYSEGTPEMGMIDPKKVKQAQTMIKMGADVSTISSITGLSEAQVNQVQQSMEKAKGGRVGYGAGGGVKALVKMINKKFGKGTVKLGKEVKRPESAEMREAFMAFKKRNKLAGGGAVKTILKIIEEIKKLDPMDAMKEVNEVVAKRGKYKNLSEEDTQKIFEDTQDHIFERDVKPKETDMDFDEAAEELASAGAPKASERFMLKQKYPGIDDNLLTQIIDDPDPQRKAEVLATIDQAFELMRQGKSHEEVYDIMKQMTDRTKQAGGGLAYLMGL
jgi:hypothetical protein